MLHRFQHIRRVVRPAVLLFCTLLCARAQEIEPVTFCSFNLKNWLTMERFDGRRTLHAATKPESEKERVVEFIKDINPGVLGVCEIGTDKDVADLKAHLKAAGLDYPHSERAHGGDTTRSLALLSRFPISARNSQTDLTYKIGETVFPMQRGILDVTVDITPQYQVRFLGVHLKSKRAVAEADEVLMRRNEAHLLRTRLDSIFAKDLQARIICYGDFNEHRNESAISEIIGSRASDGYMVDIFLRDVSGLVWTHFWDAADVYSRFDYFFVSRALKPQVDARKCYIYSARDFDKGSDHRPIVMTLNPPTLIKTSAAQE